MAKASDFYNLFKGPLSTPAPPPAPGIVSAHPTPEAPIDIVQALKGATIENVVDFATRRFLFFRIPSISTSGGTALIDNSGLCIVSLIVQADSTNTANIIVGGRQAVTANGGLELAPGQSFCVEEEEKDTGLRSWIVALFRLIVSPTSVPKFKRACIDASDFAVFSSTSGQAVRVGLGLVLEDFN